VYALEIAANTATDKSIAATKTVIPRILFFHLTTRFRLIQRVVDDL
jgi:hypothetical protein